AAAEAANIGGVVSGYADTREEDQVADEATRPLAEAGEGSAEGLEQAEAELQAAAEEPLVGASDFGGSIDDAIDQAAQPSAGETIEAPAEPLTAEPGPEPAAESAPEPLTAPAASEPFAEAATGPTPAPDAPDPPAAPP